MSTIVSRNVDELSEPSRHYLEELLGRELSAHQRIYIIVGLLHPKPSDAKRQKAAAGIRDLLAQAEHHGQAASIAPSESEAAVEDAMSEVRRRR